jgi:hypothetical protein
LDELLLLLLLLLLMMMRRRRRRRRRSHLQEYCCAELYTSQKTEYTPRNYTLNI